MPARTVKILLLFGKKIVITDNNALTNQPETGVIPSPLSSRVEECCGVEVEAVFDEWQPAEMDESEIFVFGGDGDGGAKLAEAEAAMTPAV